MGDLESIFAGILWVVAAFVCLMLFILLFIILISILGFAIMSPCVKIMSLLIFNKLTVKKSVKILKNSQNSLIAPLFPTVVVLVATILLSFGIDGVSSFEIFEKHELIFIIPLFFFLAMFPIETIALSKLRESLFHTLKRNKISLFLEDDTLLIFYLDYDNYSTLRLGKSINNTIDTTEMENKIILKRFKDKDTAQKFCDKYI